jgi:hypothetical protein
VEKNHGKAISFNFERAKTMSLARDRRRNLP